MERVELHCHSKYSKMDGIAYPYDIVKFAEDNGMPVVAITDHGSIKAFLIILIRNMVLFLIKLISMLKNFVIYNAFSEYFI